MMQASRGQRFVICSYGYTTIATSLAVLLLSFSARAATIVVSFDAQITSVAGSGIGSELLNVFSVGDPVSGSFQFDSAATPTEIANRPDRAADYSYLGAISDYRMTHLGRTAIMDNGAIRIIDDIGFNLDPPLRTDLFNASALVDRQSVLPTQLVVNELLVPGWSLSEMRILLWDDNTGDALTG